MTPIHLEIDSSYEDYLAALKAHRRATRRYRVVIWMVASAAILIVILYDLFRYDKPTPAEWLGMPAIYIALIVLFPLLGRPPLWFKRYSHKWRRNARLGETVTAVYTEEGDDVTTLNTRTFWKWDVFSHYVEGPDVFLLYFTPDRFVYLHKRFLTEKQIDAFRELMVKHVRLIRFKKRQPPGFPVQLAGPPEPTARLPVKPLSMPSQESQRIDT